MCDCCDPIRTSSFVRGVLPAWGAVRPPRRPHAARPRDTGGAADPGAAPLGQGAPSHAWPAGGSTAPPESPSIREATLAVWPLHPAQRGRHRTEKAPEGPSPSPGGSSLLFSLRAIRVHGLCPLCLARATLAWEGERLPQVGRDLAAPHTDPTLQGSSSWSASCWGVADMRGAGGAGTHPPPDSLQPEEKWGSLLHSGSAHPDPPAPDPRLRVNLGIPEDCRDHTCHPGSRHSPATGSHS